MAYYLKRAGDRTEARLTMSVHPNAGKPPDPSMLVDVDRLIAAYYRDKPDPAVPGQRVAFGTSGHRGSSFDRAFNENHILAVSQAICEHRAAQGIDGPLYLGIDTHALSAPAAATALEVLAANGVTVMIAAGDEFTPTPAISHAILTYNRGRKGGLADGIVITPSHNPPGDGGFKYNPPNGGPADTDVTGAVQARANALLEAGLAGVDRIPHERALRANTTQRHDFVSAYVGDLDAVIDMAAIRGSGLKLGVDPLGGAGVAFLAAHRRALWDQPHRRRRYGRPEFRFYDRRLGRADPDGPLIALRDAAAVGAQRPLRGRIRL